MDRRRPVYSKYQFLADKIRIQKNRDIVHRSRVSHVSFLSSYFSSSSGHSGSCQRMLDARDEAASAMFTSASVNAAMIRLPSMIDLTSLMKMNKDAFDNITVCVF